MSSKTKGSAVAHHGAPLRQASHPLAGAAVVAAQLRSPQPNGTVVGCQAGCIGCSKVDRMGLGAAGRAIVS